MNSKNTRKIMISLGVVGAAAAVAGMGTFGTFTSTTSGSQNVASGTVNIAMGAGDLTVDANKLVAGDTVQRAFTLANGGTADLGAVTLTTTAQPTTKLDTDATNGLQMKIDSCSAAWTKAGTPTAPTYTCTGTTKSVIAPKPVIGAGTAVNNLAAIGAGNADNLLVTMTLPQIADNTFQNLSSTINYKFDATQRTAANR